MIWKPVVGYEGIYEVSDCGQVRSLNRVDCDGRRRKGRILKRCPDDHGYLTVTLCKGGEEKTHKVHRLVDLTFLGPPGDGEEVCHGPNGKQDNSVENLSWAPVGRIAEKTATGTTLTVPHTPALLTLMMEGQALGALKFATRERLFGENLTLTSAMPLTPGNRN